MEGCYQTELQCQSGLTSAISKVKFPMILLRVPSKGLMVQITSSAALSFLLLNLNFECDILAWVGIWMQGTPCHWEGNEKGGSRPICINVLYWSSTGCICVNSFLCLSLLFRASGRFLSLCYCFICSLNLPACFSWTKMQLSETRREIYILPPFAIALFLRQKCTPSVSI